MKFNFSEYKMSPLNIQKHLTEVAVALYESQVKDTAFLYGLCERELVLIISNYFQVYKNIHIRYLIDCFS